jgi:hypothetical protein
LSIASRIWPGCVYRSVIRRVFHPPSACKVAPSTPASAALLAIVWRIVCGVITFCSPAAAITLRQAFVRGVYLNVALGLWTAFEASIEDDVILLNFVGANIRCNTRYS